MNKLLSWSLLGMLLMALTGAANAQCENMRVVVRNSVYAIHGLEAFCTEFNKLKADMAGMRSELVIAKRDNAMLKARLTGTTAQVRDEALAQSDMLEMESALESLPR